VSVPTIPVPPRLSTEDADQARASANTVAQNLGIAFGSKTWTLKPWMIRSWIGFDWVDGVYGPVVDRTKIPGSFKGIEAAVARPVGNPAFLKRKRGHISGGVAARCR